MQKIICIDLRRTFFIITAILLFAVSAQAQRNTTLDGRPAKLVADLDDWRDCKYYLVNDPEQYITPNADLWILQKVLPNGRRITVLNPYCTEGAIKDAKLVGYNLYVINTTYRSGDNLACLDTRTGKWSNPIPDCNQCHFVGWNRIWVEYAELIYRGDCIANDRYSYSERTYTLE